ncbi:MAG: spore coat associated protein CotJA [Lachnospiraceae bacterium]|nr:spore coat associated protein CotJA [Lachnospiraceae bacterium]
MTGQCSGSYTPDYAMRRRNQECGCRRSPRPEGRPDMPGHPGRDAGSPPPVGGPCCSPAPRPRSGMAPEAAVSSDIDQFPVGMTYVPWQTWQNLYEAEYGFQVGTIFGDLDYPWEVGRCCRR